MATTITTSQTASTLPQKKGDPPNFGTVKSGRALAFDGVVDSLVSESTHSFLNLSQDFTYAVWIKATSLSDAVIINYGDDGSNRSGIVLSSTGKIGFSTYNGSGYIHAATPSEDYISIIQNQWHRVVATCSNNTLKFYLNGVEQTNTTEIFTSALASMTHNRFTIGSRSHGSSPSKFFAGYISDLQVWSAVWSLTDVQNDYRHIEMLAHTFSGTSLTESNLKIWYPMTEGSPESPQTTIFDGSPKVLGSELVINGGFDTDTAWTTAEEWSIDTVNGVAKGNGTVGNLTQVNILVSGKYYKVTYTIKDYVSGSVRVELSDDNSKGITRSSNGTFTEIFKANNDYVRFDARTAFTGSIDDVSVKEIQRGNHATSLFYGDELITVVKDKNFDASNNWDVTSANWSIDGNSLDYDGSGGGTASLDETYPAFVVGKTYQIKFNIDAESKIAIKDGDSSNTLVSDATYSSGTKTVEFVAPATTDGLSFTPFTGCGAFAMDWVNVKEVGLSTTGHVEGEETIFQPAFVGQNRMIAFDGVNDIVTISDHDDFTFGDGSNDSAFSISAWICMDDAVSYSIITKGTEWSLHTANSKLYLWIRDDSAGVNPTVNTNALSPNQWYHVVATYDGTGGATAHSGMELYVNGIDAKATADGHSSYVAMENGSSDVIIGKYSSYYANGITTEACIWNKELSLAEVQELYNNGVALDVTSHSAVSNLKGYWRNNSLTTSGLWEDLSTNSHNGTLSGGSTVILPEGTTSGRDINGFFLTHPNKNYLSLDGTDDCYMVVPDSEVLDGYDAMTWSFWIKPHSLADDDTILDKWVSTGNQRSWRMYIDDSNEIALQISSTGANDEAQKTTDLNLTLNTWWYITIVFNAGAFTVYKNDATGVTEDGSFGTTLTIFNSSANLLIGGSNTSNTEFDGLIDDIRIYNRALTTAEISKNYKHGSGKHKD